MNSHTGQNGRSSIDLTTISRRNLLKMVLGLIAASCGTALASRALDSQGWILASDDR